MSTTAPTATTTEPRRYGLVVGADDARAGADAPVPRYDPARGRLVAEYAHASAQDVDAAVAAARAAFDDGPWPRLPGAERARLLRAFAAAVDRERERLARLDSEEAGKPLHIARGDLGGVVGHIEYAASLAHTDHGDSWSGIDTGFVAWATQVPVGVAALIIPWNFPALIVAQKLPYALAAGCTVVVKPSELTSSTAIELARLALAAGIPPGVVNVVTGLGATTGAALVSHPGVDMVSFTGSTATGRRVAEQAGRGLKRVGLELGGKAATVVFADADLDQAADAAVFAAFFNNGECCVSGTRLLVQDGVADELIAEVVRRAATLAVGAPDDAATDVGPLISPQHRDRVLGYARAGAEDGAELLLGGAAPGDPALADGNYVVPTIFGATAPGQRIFDEEVFGPLLSVATFRDLEDAARLANATTYGLANALFTRDVGTATALADRLRSGTVWVNTAIDGAPALAFGGMKGSGLGREAGLEGLREFTESKTIQIRSGARELPLPRR